MFCLKFSLKQNISTLNLKNIICIIEKGYINTLAGCQHLHSKPVYRLQEYSTGNKRSDVTLSEDTSKEVTTSTFETIKKNTKTAWYSGIIITGVGIAAIISYTIFNQLISSKSPNSVYSTAFDKCIKDEKVIFALGEPIKGYGEESSRGRRQHVRYILYEKDGVNYMRMKFYLKGSRKTATVHLEVKENDSGKFEYRYLFVQIDGYPYTTIVLEDNRNKSTLAPLPPLSDSNIAPVLS